MKDKFDKMFDALKKGKLEPKTEEAAFRITITDAKTGKTLDEYNSNGILAAIDVEGEKTSSVCLTHCTGKDLLGLILSLRKLLKQAEAEFPEELRLMLPFLEAMADDHS